MDEFLRDIHTMLFKQWILIQDQSQCQIYLDDKNENIIDIKTNYSFSQVIFNPLNIIELSVTNTMTQNIEFYLHFQMKTMKHATELFNEMMNNILQLVDKPKIKILLSCSGGLTTSYFASKLNEAAQILDYHYEVRAIGYTDLFNVGNEYDVILLAPQISFMHAKVQEILKDKIVLKVPPQVFAKYDVVKTLQLVRHALEHQKLPHNSKTESTIKPLQVIPHQNTKILVLSLFRNSLRVHIAYHLYDEQNHIISSNEIIKFKISMEDIYDVIDTILLQYPRIQIIGISTPGIINNGFVASTSIIGLNNFNMYQLLKERYHQHIVIDNDVNTAAVGYYASQQQFSSLIFLFQPNNHFGGAGIIVNGQLVKGHAHIAGEVQYLPLNYSAPPQTLAKTPEGALELVSKTIVALSSVIGPEAIILSCTLIPDVDELKKMIAQYIPKKYLPRIIKIENIQEYILIGQLILCLQEYK